MSDAAGAWPPVIGFVGPKDAGKTTLLCHLLPLLRSAGLRVGAIKHAHHALRLDDPTTDSARLEAAGASAALATGADVAWTQAITTLLQAGPTPDLIILEGYHQATVPQLAILPEPAAWPAEQARSRGWTIATVGPWAGGTGALPHFSRDEPQAIAAFVAAACRPVPAGRTAVAAAVLAGGASRRMGQAKATLRMGGRTWLQRVRSAATDATGGPALIVGGSGNEPWRVPDLLPGQGPLAGLATAWQHLRSPWLLLLACDLPLVPGPALALVCQHIPAGGPVAAVIPVVAGQRQYTAAVYARAAWPQAVAALGEGQRSLRAFAQGLDVLEVPEEAFSAHGLNAAGAFRDFDDPQSLAAWAAGVTEPGSSDGAPPRRH